MTADPSRSTSTPFQNVAPTTLRDRRRHLRRQRGWRSLRGTFRLLAIAGFAAGSVALLVRPSWIVRRADDITVRGNQWLSDEVLRSLVPLDYPASLLHVDPQQIAAAIEANAPVADATVNRQLLPPRLVLRVRERHPVAVAYHATAATGIKAAGTRIGLLDAQGLWTPLENYDILDRLELPKLRVLGASDRYRDRWPQVYAALQRSPVVVSEIDWRDPADAILTTPQFGRVRVGAIDDRFADQLQALDRLRDLANTPDLDHVAYIDLRDPERPYLQLRADAPAPVPPRQ